MRDRRPSQLDVRELHERYHSPALEEPAEAPRYSMSALAEPLPYVDPVTPVERHGGPRDASIRVYNVGGGELAATLRPGWGPPGRPTTLALPEESSATTDVRLPKLAGPDRDLCVDVEAPSTRDWWTHTEIDLSDATTDEAPPTAHVERQWRLWRLVICDQGEDPAKPHDYFLVAGFEGLPSQIRAIDCDDGVWTVEATTGGEAAARYRCAPAQTGGVCPPLAEDLRQAEDPVIRIPCPDGARSATASKEWLRVQKIARLRRRDTSVRVVRARVALGELLPGINDVVVATAGPDGDTGTVRCVVVAPVVAHLGELTVDRQGGPEAATLDVQPHHPSVHVDPSCSMGRLMRFGDEVYTYQSRHAGPTVSLSTEIAAWRPVLMQRTADGASWETVVADRDCEGSHDYRFDIGGEWRADPRRLTSLVWGPRGLVSSRQASSAVQEVSVDNRGGQPVEITVRGASDWVTGSPGHQTVAGRATGSVAVRVDPSARPLGPSLAYVELHVQGDWAPFIVPVHAWIDVDGPVLDIPPGEYLIVGVPTASVDIPVRVWGAGQIRVQALPPRSAPLTETTLEGAGYGIPDEQTLRAPLGDRPASWGAVDQLKLLSDSYLADRRATHVDVKWPSHHASDAVVHLPRIFAYDRTASAFFALDVDDDWSALDIRLPEQLTDVGGIRCEPMPALDGCILSIDPSVTPPGRLQGWIEVRHASYAEPRRVRVDAHILESIGECHLQSREDARLLPRGANPALTIRNVGAMDLMVFDVQASDRRLDIRPAIPSRTILAPGEQVTAELFATGRPRWIPRAIRGSVRVLMSDARSGGRPWTADVSVRG